MHRLLAHLDLAQSLSCSLLGLPGKEAGSPLVLIHGVIAALTSTYVTTGSTMSGQHPNGTAASRGHSSTRMPGGPFGRCRYVG
jgi:hypothetical protein